MALSLADIVSLSRLLDEALALDKAGRAAWLEALTAADRVHEARLRDMLDLQASADADQHMASLPRLTANEEVAHAGDSVGPYRLLREIGRGGMGSVWLAERADGRYSRQVALKLPRLAWGGGLAERMAREREIGMLLEHPAIARLYDAGLDERGRPYLALEYIGGLPLDAWCKARALDIPTRLRLFLQVVRAVAYAHGRLVIHRDLKPSNVLVSEDGQAHLLDFGIAKLLTEEMADKPDLTQQRGQVMTPHYASPEQLRNEAITVSSDVYSLGVLLYELLTGTLPHSVRRNSLGALEEAILGSEPPPASSKAPDPATKKALRGELDAILAKALRSDVRQRYATADALADDIERHLSGGLVLAQPDSLRYRVTKTLRRHRFGFAAGAAVLASMLVGAGLAIVQAQRAQVEAERATAAADRARVVKDFVVDVFKVNSRDSAAKNEARQLPVDLLLDRGARLIDVKFAGQPELQAELFGIVTRIMLDMNADQLALQYASKYVLALKGAGGLDDRGEGALLLAEALQANKKEAEAEIAVREALASDAGSELQVRARLQLVDLLLLKEDYPGARSELDRIDKDLAAHSQWPAALDARSVFARARVLARTNQFDQAKPLYEQAIAMALAAEGPESRVASTIRISYANRLVATGFTDAAKGIYKQAFDAMRVSGGTEDLQAALAETDSVSFLASNNAVSYNDANAVFAKTLGILDRQGARVPTWVRADVEHSQSCIVMFFGHAEQGYVLASKSVPILRITTHDPTAGSCLAWSQMMTGRHAEAEAEYQQLVAREGAVNGCTAYCAAHTYVAMAHNRLMQGHHQQARALLDSVPELGLLNGATPAQASRPQLSIRVERARVELEAGHYQVAIDLLDDVPDAKYMINDSAFMRAEALCRLGKASAAIVAMRQGLTRREERSGYEFSPWLADMRARTGLCELVLGNRRQAQGLADLARKAFEAQPGVSPYYKQALHELDRRLS